MVSKLNKNRTLLSSTVSMGVIALFAFSGNAFAQETKTKANETVIVTGSSIKRKVLDSALPIQIISQEDIKRESISSTEQLIALLNSNGNGLDNLSSNADVVAGAARGNNGMSAANLRGQGTAGTLILLNGRRVAAHGLNGGAVDINQIPMAAIERVDVLKDGASAIYGTDAIGGVINFITKKSYQGLNLQVFGDKTEAGGGDIYRASIAGGIGNLDTQNWNLMGTLSYSENKALNANQRDFVNAFQLDKGLSVDTRGTPFATIFPLAGSLFVNNTNPLSPLDTNPFVIGSSTIKASSGINILNLPGGAGCNSIKNMQDYAETLWNGSLATAETAKYACAYDTGDAVVLQQPVKNLNFISKGTFNFGEHQLTIEATASKVNATKRFSEPQLSSNTTSPYNSLGIANGASANYMFRRVVGVNDALYDSVFDTLKSTFGLAESRRGQPMALRWRCLECGQREISTETKTKRFLVGMDGPLGKTGWEYRTGVSYASSESQSTLGEGYYYSYSVDGTGKVVGSGLFDALNSGKVNFFLKPGQTQSAEALALIKAASASGTVLYGGQFTVTEIDGSASGPLFDLPGGKAMGAVGFDLRNEGYRFNGDLRAEPTKRAIFLAPFDDVNALKGISRDVSAFYAELLLPIFKDFELTLAGRVDGYQDFGSTFNPKVSLKYRPFTKLMFRGSYNTGFRVPTFNQIYNGTTESPFTTNKYADPLTCAAARSSSTPGCANVSPFNTWTGGSRALKPEEAEQMSFGAVFEPSKNFSLSLDWWKIERTNTIQVPTLDNLFDNYSDFASKFIRDNTGKIVAVDQRYINDGGSLTEGVEVSLRGRRDIFGGSLSAGMDGTYLLEKKSKVLADKPYGASEVGVWTPYGDLGVRWKHNIFVTYKKGDWSGSVSQIFREGYIDQVYTGVAAGIFTPTNGHTKTENYVTYNASVTYKGFKNFTITGGIKNLLDTDPPFAYAYYSNSGANSSWEPRIADPRGRSFTLLLDYKF